MSAAGMQTGQRRARPTDQWVGRSGWLGRQDLQFQPARTRPEPIKQFADFALDKGFDPFANNAKRRLRPGQRVGHHVNDTRQEFVDFGNAQAVPRTRSA